MKDIELSYKELEEEIKQINDEMGIDNCLIYLDNDIRKHIENYFPKYALYKIKMYLNEKKVISSKFKLETMVEDDFGIYYGLEVRFDFDNFKECLKISIFDYIEDNKVKDILLIQFFINHELLKPQNNINDFLDKYLLSDKLQCLYDMKEYLINECMEKYYNQEYNLRDIKIENYILIMTYDHLENKKYKNISIPLKEVMKKLGIDLSQFKKIIINPEEFTLPE
jgi:hypothetical protein